jgi:hypothetical protein
VTTMQAASTTQLITITATISPRSRCSETRGPVLRAEGSATAGGSGDGGGGGGGGDGTGDGGDGNDGDGDGDGDGGSTMQVRERLAGSRSAAPALELVPSVWRYQLEELSGWCTTTRVVHKSHRRKA